MSAEDLRRRVGNAPYTGSMKIEDPDMFYFLRDLSNSNHDYSYIQVSSMSDEELMERWARYMIERNSE